MCGWMTAFGEYSRRRDIIKCELLGKFYFLERCVDFRISNRIPDRFDSPLTPSASLWCTVYCSQFPLQNVPISLQKVNCELKHLRWIGNEHLNVRFQSSSSSTQSNSFDWLSGPQMQSVCQFNRWPWKKLMKKLLHSDWKASNQFFFHEAFEFVFKSFRDFCWVG